MHASSSPSASRRCALALGALLLGACAGSVHLPEPTEALARHVPGTTLAELTEGRRLFVARCSGCHNLPSPRSHRADEWAAEVAEMGKRAKLSEAQQGLVTRYLQAVAREGPGAAAAR